MEDLRPTLATEVQPPASLPEAECVDLMFLRDTEGASVRVLVSPIDELELIDLLGALPGQHDPEALEGSTGGLGAVWRQFAPIATQVIERACTPRFCFADTVPEGQLPGKWLRDSEKLGLVLSALRVSGWTGGAAELAAGFLRMRAGRVAGAERAPGDGGTGTVGLLPGDEADAVAGDARPDAGIQPHRDAGGGEGAGCGAGASDGQGAVH